MDPTRSMNKNFLLKIMLISSAMSIVLLSFRMYLTGSPMYIFLSWNLFLAWIPFIATLCINEAENFQHNRWLKIFFFILWLVFFPNSPYIITDLFHLHARPGMPLWFDLFLIISFAWNGLMLGFASLLRIQKLMNSLLKNWQNWALVSLLMFLCGYGVYLGRFERWNSWDLLTHGNILSESILKDILDPFSNLRMLGVTVVYGSFLLLGYIMLLAMIDGFKNEKHEN